MTEKIQRIARKKRHHVYLSHELLGVVDQLTDRDTPFSSWAEAALWRQLAAEYGEEAVRDAVEDVQADLADDQLLADPDRVTSDITLEA